MPDAAWETIDLQVTERVAWVTLNRPESLNAFTPQMGRELLEALTLATADPGLRVVVLQGAGRGFSSGADLRQAVSWGADGRIDLLTPLREVFHPLILRLRTLELPVIASVHGGAVGFGCSLALAADLVIAAESAYFLMGFASVGLTLDGGSSALLTGRVGYARAAEMALLAERVDAAQACAWGLTNRVVPDQTLHDATAELAARLAVGSPGSYAASKRALNQAAHPMLEQQLELEAKLQQERAESQDFVEGVRAFLEKRRPQFTGK